MTFILILLMSELIPHQFTESPGVDEFVMISDSVVFFLDSDQEKILRYDFEEDSLKIVAGKGQGPGELQNPKGILFFNDRVVLHDAGFFHFYRRDGRFQETLRLNPEQYGAAWPAIGGMFSIVDHGQLKKLIFHDHKGTNSELLTWEPIDQSRYVMKDGKLILHYNPAPDKEIVSQSKDGKRLYFKNPGSFEILIFDGQTGQKLGVIRKDYKPISFDQSQGEQAVLRLKQRQPSLKVIAAFPRTYPIIKAMSVGADDKLGVRLYSDERVTKNIYFDADGQSQEGFIDEIQRRLMGQASTHALISLYNSQTDIWQVMRCKNDRIVNLIDKYPIRLE